MKLVSYSHNTGPRLGVILDDSVVDLSRANTFFQMEAREYCMDAQSFVSGGIAALQKVSAILERVRGEHHPNHGDFIVPQPRQPSRRRYPIPAKSCA